MVGGIWRALARLDMQLTGYPLPITHQYAHGARPPGGAAAGDRRARARSELQACPSLSTSRRMPTLPHANLLLEALVDGSSRASWSSPAYGIREGLLYDELEPRPGASSIR